MVQLISRRKTNQLLKFNAHMVFDRKLGKHVAKQLDIQIAEDAENYRTIFPPGVRTLKYFFEDQCTRYRGHRCHYMLHGTGTEMLKRLGLKKLHLFESTVALIVADKRVMTILG